MSLTSGMFLFEVVVENVNSMVDSKHLLIKSDFADIFSLELRDPKQMNIVMPEPLPLPPEPPGKKKKKAKPKKPKKGKKGKGAVVLPPPEPAIQSGQSVLFASSAEVLIENMNKFPLEVSLWSKEKELVYIGSVSIPWDPVFRLYLTKISECQEPPPVLLRDDYNIFQEGLAKRMAKIGLQVKLRFLNNKVTTEFRTLSEDPNIRKCLYTGMNSKTTSFMCTMKTTDENFEENCNKIENQFVVDKPKGYATTNKVKYACYTNAPGANLTFFNEGDYCCMNHADKPPDSIYKAPETCPDIDFIVDYVRKIIVSCNDNMRMLTPRPTIRPRIKATDIDRLCYCKETKWPPGTFAERFKREAQSEPCPLCIDSGKKKEGTLGTTFDIANIRGPCGRADCRIARDIRSYIENLVDEDNIEFDLNELIGPCGTKDCTIAQKIQDVVRHEGAFTEMQILPGLSTQCACLETMQKELIKKESCSSACSKECETTDSNESQCGGPSCPFGDRDITRVYNVYYFTVEHDFVNKDENPSTHSPTSVKSKNTNQTSEKSNHTLTSEKTDITPINAPTDNHDKYKYCPTSCPSVKLLNNASCSKAMCCYEGIKLGKSTSESKCTTSLCLSRLDYPVSPADSNIVMDFHEIYNPCCVKSCDVAERIKSFIAESAAKENKRRKCKELYDTDPCYCDCTCTFKFSNKTTYCAVCGGYECIGDDTRDLPPYARPHPCPVYHKLYDKNRIKVKSPWPDKEGETMEKKDAASGKLSKSGFKTGDKSSEKDVKVKEPSVQEKPTKAKSEKKKAKNIKAKPSAEPSTVEKKAEKKLDTKKYPYPSVPRNMGWNWNAEDIPGLKPRPKWRPGAVNKILVRRYRAIRDGTENIAKKKRALMQRKKKIEMKPTLVISKQDGEYTVQMEVFKKYSKERLVHQYPYEEKPPLVYTVGKTEAERVKIQKQRDRKARRETRRKNRLLQSTFRDKCQEICLKAYNQAIGLLPLPNPNDPDCPCNTSAGPNFTPIIDSCSCSDEGTISSSDTDHDEWVIEFTPPMAKWDPKAKHPSVLVENECQYNYMDYKVKLFDKSGNPVPRFFKGPDGNQECSDIGGFWGPGKVWLEINKDGYVGPDGRWVPMNFIGPDGMFYSAEEGSFTDNSGYLLKIGIDGYIDKDLKWVWYPNKKPIKSSKSNSPVVPGGTKAPEEHLTGKEGIGKETIGKSKTDSTTNKGSKEQKTKSEKGSGDRATKGNKKDKMKEDKDKGKGDKDTCKGDKSKTKEVKDNVKEDNGKGRVENENENLNIKAKASVKKHKEKVMAMSLSVHRDRSKTPHAKRDQNCKPWVDCQKLSVYREIMQGLQEYDDLGDLKPAVMTNRASNTPRKRLKR